MENKNITEDIVTPIPAPKPEIGIDTDKEIVDEIIQGAQVGALDVSSIDALSSSAQNREQTYELLDAMAQDDVVSAILESYTEDTVQTNDSGKKIWVESSDPNILSYTNWLMDTLNIGKHIDQWVHCLVTYGDVYVRLYRKSDYEDDLLFKNSRRNRQLNEAVDKKEPLNEDVLLRTYKDNDPYVPYVEMVPNPGEMFDLQKFGKTYGFIKTPVRVVQQTTDQLYNYLTRYKMKQQDIEIYDATSFVHGCIDSTTQRQPETVDIYLDGYDVTKEDDYDITDNKHVKDSMTTSYSVKRGQSILYNSFRIWRELNLLEMSALLNRITQSSVVRVITVDTGDMSKNQASLYLQRLKERIEQKSALKDDTGLGEYNNPAPIINTIYLSSHNGQGNIHVDTIGGDYDPKALTDIEYFRDKLFGSLRVLKQNFGFTDDGAGFNGGTSLTILSSRYGKVIKRIQAIMCQMVTDIFNLFLIDRGLVNYVNKFSIRMQEPVTQEEIDRRSNNDNRLRYIGDVMQQLVDVEDRATKLNIYKALLGNTINNPEVMGYLQAYIDSLGKGQEVETQETVEKSLEIEEELTQQDLREDVDDDSDSFIPSPEDINYDALNDKKLDN